jgi:hypothetical protein
VPNRKDKMKAREASEVKRDPARSVGRASGFGFFALFFLLVGSPCGAQTAQSGEIRLPVLSNSLDGRVIGAPEDAFLPVWKPIESNNGEVTYVDMKSIERGAAGMQVEVYTSVPNTIFDMDKLKVLAFDCQGHFMPFDEEGMTEWMDAPPRSVAGEIAETVCVNQSVQEPAQSTPDNSTAGRAQSNTIQPFTSANGRFSVMFHAIPQQFPQPIHLKNGKTGTAYVFYARADNDKTGDYVTYTDYSPDVIAPASPQVLLQKAEKGFVAGKTLLSEQVIDLDGIPGRAYTASDSDGNFYTAHEFLAGTRIYQVLVLTTKSNFPSGQDNGQFLNSFRILGNPPRP